jgi:flagellar biosynthesis anti-sigma factor FlgM
MNIDRIQSELIRAYGGRALGVRGGPTAGGDAARTAENASSASATDGIVISDEAALLSRLANGIASAPDVREDLVATIRAQIQNGTYKTADAEVARRLLSGASGD